MEPSDSELNHNNSNGDEKDDDMSLEERMAWLRERGVLVETAEERKRQQVAAAVRQADAALITENGQQQHISYVLVPADTSQPLQERTFQPNPTIPGDGLLLHLKQTEFAKKSTQSVDVELLRQHGGSTTLAASAADLPTVSDSTLQQIASEANVETFSLVHPIPSNNFTGINIYLDEVGMLKRLPLNKRASDLAARAGFNPAPIFYGDVFLGRIQQRPQLQNRSFVLGVDTDFNTPGAAWLRTAVNDNLHYQQQINAATGQKDVVQAGVAGSDGQVQQEDGYSWTQTEGEIEVVVPLPADATSKQVKVAFRPLVLEVLYLAEPHVNLPLFERVDVDACTWTLDRSGSGGDNVDNATKLVITMEKVEEAFWPRIRD